MTEVEQAIRADLSLDRAYQHMAFLVEEVGERLAGTPSMEQAAGYIQQQLELAGLEARIDRFPIYHSFPGSAALRVTFPEERVIDALPSCHIPSTLRGGLTGELVYVGAGGYEEYQPLDVGGKVVLADMTWAPPRPEKARIALEHGAKAIIILNWGTLDNPVIQRGAIKSVWGNPTPESVKRIPQIPAINITRAAGECLKRLCAEGRVEVWLRADATREWVLANQPVGLLHGRGAEEFVLVGGHLEAWGQTAVCNSSGNAVMLELARVLATHSEKLRRQVLFAFWDGHEIAEAAGSAHFVDTHWDDLVARCVAYVNIDNPGILGTSRPESQTTPEVKALLLKLVQEMWGQTGTWKMPYKGGDQSFCGIGVPYINFSTGYTPEELERLNWAFLGPWLHSEADTLDKVDRLLFEKHLHFFAGLVVRLCNAAVIPYDLAELVGLLEVDLQALRALTQGAWSGGVDSLLDRVGQLQRAVEGLNRRKAVVLASHPTPSSAIDVINAALIRVPRELSWLWTEAGKYDHDPYGYHLVGKPVPRLYVPLTRLRALAGDAAQLELWITHFLRERNRVSDAIGHATDWVLWANRIVDGLV
jgi:hypothetical protein